MRKLMLLSSAALLCLAPDVFAQATAKPAVQISNEVTVTGCVMRESDYRKLHSDGRGGVLGSGVGVGDEFVLASATPSMNTNSGRRGAAGRDRVEARPVEDRAVGTRGAAAGRSYTLTGPLEQNLSGDVGRMVQVVGKVEKAAGTGTTAAIEDLPNLTITVWHPVGDFCPVAK
jgi:hypothetical protein